MDCFDVTINSLDELEKVAVDLINKFPDDRFFAFYGEMGVGKTTFIQSICKALNVPEEAISPTFAIVNEYSSSEGIAVYHFDFYRINDLEEVYDIGYEDYFYSDSFCFVEWPELVESLLPDRYIKITLRENEDKSRRLIAVSV